MLSKLPALLLLCALASGCNSAPWAARGASALPAPIEPPGPGASGCVESAELRAFVLALEAQRAQARARALAQLGVVERLRPSRFVASPALQGARVHESEGQRFALVAQLATSTPPLVPLAQREQLLQPIDERPRPHPIPVVACGMNACPSPVQPVLPPVRALAVVLVAGEQLGPPLRLSYDYWWAQVSFDRARSCAPPVAGSPPPGAVGKH